MQITFATIPPTHSCCLGGKFMPTLTGQGIGARPTAFQSNLALTHGFRVCLIRGLPCRHIDNALGELVGVAGSLRPLHAVNLAWSPPGV